MGVSTMTVFELNARLSWVDRRPDTVQGTFWTKNHRVRQCGLDP